MLDRLKLTRYTLRHVAQHCDITHLNEKQYPGTRKICIGTRARLTFPETLLSKLCRKVFISLIILEKSYQEDVAFVLKLQLIITKLILTTHKMLVYDFARIVVIKIHLFRTCSPA